MESFLVICLCMARAEKITPIEMERSASPPNLDSLAATMRSEVPVEDRRYLLRTYDKCFIGAEAVTWLIRKGHAVSEEDAIELGQFLLSNGYFHHVTRDHTFKNEYLFYRFREDEKCHGQTAKDAKGNVATWGDYALRFLDSEFDRHFDSDMRPSMISKDRSINPDSKELIMEVSPLDKYNIQLLDNVHPASWERPAHEDIYNLVVIGAGAGGLVSAIGAAGLGARVAIIEEHMMGGDCLNFGCVPSKALLKSASVAHTIQHKAAEHGIEIAPGSVKINFGSVMERMRRIRAEISKNDSAERCAALGVDVFLGRGVFDSPNSIVVDRQRLTFRRCIIASGGYPYVPAIPGLDTVPYLTNISVFNLTSLPPRLAVIGGGPIGIELAQAFARFGSRVTVVVRGNRILPKEEEDAAMVVYESLLRDGVSFCLDCTVIRAGLSTSGHDIETVLELSNGDVLTVDSVLLATGRRPHVKGMGLESAGVQYSEQDGIRISDTLRTSNSNIFAVGDCCSHFQFTHVADFMARIAIRNSLFFGRSQASSLLIPWCTYTDPEIAHVGLYPSDLIEKNILFKKYVKYFADNDRAVCEGSMEGFVKIYIRDGSDEILGATIVGEGAGDMISEISVAMRAKMGLGTLGNVIHPYPTRAEAVRHTGDNYNRTRLTTFVKSILRNVISFQR